MRNQKDPRNNLHSYGKLKIVDSIKLPQPESKSYDIKIANQIISYMQQEESF